MRILMYGFSTLTREKVSFLSRWIRTETLAGIYKRQMPIAEISPQILPFSYLKAIECSNGSHRSDKKERPHWAIQ